MKSWDVLLKKRLWKRYGVALSLSVAFALVSLLAFLTASPLPPESSGVLVVIAEGSSTSQIASELHSRGVIKSPFLFRVFARILGVQGQLQAGEYIFEPGMTLFDVMSSIRQGRVIHYRLTIREGLSVEQIATVIEERGFGSREAFLEACKDPELVRKWATPAELEKTRYPVEGYLFPDTYYIRRGLTERDLVVMMITRFSQVVGGLLEKNAGKHGLSPHQLATLASIVEKEAVSPEERPIIARVFLNRLAMGMKLDADPTVLYAVGKTSGVPLYKDLAFDSPYNTYKYPGLPPGPIAGFGKAALEAVINPASVDYLYFVSKNDGTHAFAQTYEEHLRNVRKYQGR
ncbi:MAG: endolytic transglycosylase MltG [Firmicutes bacterium]|nr:endolytic transglycosylase MltG [Candidatus Fermentithermobacillaceae bacterium]